MYFCIKRYSRSAQKKIVKSAPNKYKYVQNSKPYLIRGWPGVWEEAGGSSRRGVIRKVSVGRRGRTQPAPNLASPIINISGKLRILGANNTGLHSINHTNYPVLESILLPVSSNP